MSILQVKAYHLIRIQLAFWVQNSILEMDDPRQRSLIIKHFILVAEVRLFSFNLCKPSLTIDPAMPPALELFKFVRCDLWIKRGPHPTVEEILGLHQR